MRIPLNLLGYFGLLLVSLVISTKILATEIPSNVFDRFRKNAERILQLERAQQQLQKQQKQQEIINRVIKKRQNIIKQKPNTKLKKISNNQCFDIKKIIIEQSSLLNLDTQKNLYQSFVGRCLDIVEINKLLKKITNYYVLKGFITSKAGIKLGSNLRTGTLKIQTQEGKVNNIIINFYPTELMNNNKKAAFPNIKNKLLNIKDIEQGLEQINKLTSQKATMKIKPTMEKIAYSDIVVTIKKIAKANYVALSSNNYGNETTGENPLTIKLYFEDLNHNNDTLIISHKNDKKKSPYNERYNISQNNNLNFSVPVGFNNWTLSLNQTISIQQIKGRVQEFESSSWSNTGTIDFMHNIFKTRQQKFSMGASLTIYETKNYINDALVEISSRKMTNFALKLNYLKYLTGGYFSANLNLGRGLDGLGATKDTDTDEEKPKIQYQFGKLTMSYMKRFNTKIPINLSINLTTQKADTELLSTQKCAVGGLGSVNGFATNTVSEANCLITNVKLYSNIFKGFGTPNSFLDKIVFGLMWDKGLSESFINKEKNRLSSTGYYLKFNNRYVQFSYSNNTPSDSPDIFEDETLYPKKDTGNTRIDLTLKYPF